MSTPCDAPLTFEALLDYHAGDLPAAEAERVEEHYFSCFHCSQRLEVVSRLDSGLRDLIRGGRLMMGGTMALVDRARAQEVVVREYRTDPEEHVQCTAGPEDQLLVTRYGGLHGVTSVDVHFRGAVVGADQVVAMELVDVPVDQRTGDLVLLAPGALNRTFPPLEIEIRLTAHTPGGPHEVGPYHYHHRPWDLLDDAERQRRQGR